MAYKMLKVKLLKKIGILSLLSATILCFFNYTHANSEYEYTNLDISANILEDGTIDVEEKYVANFFVKKHGIIRTIPLNYSVSGTKFHIDISNINVEGKTFTTTKRDGEWEIKIGDANKTIIGQQIYPISYTTYGLIKNFSEMGYSELYWNLVGNAFDTNINKVRAVIHLPKTYTGFTNDDFLIAIGGTKISVEDFPGKINRNQGNKIIITYDKGLSAYQGITLAIKFPNDYFKFDHEKQKGLIGNATSKNTDYDYSTSNIYENIIENVVADIDESISPDITEDSDSDSTLDMNLDIAENTVSNNTSSIASDITSDTDSYTNNDNYSNVYDNKESGGNKTKLHDNSEYEYTNLDITAHILKDGTIDVDENFTADFFVPKHGMIRDISLNYTVEGTKFHIDVSGIRVPGKTFTTSKNGGNIEIKIGDADKTLIGEQDYPISYSAYGLVRNFSDMGYAELYWNLVGYDFDTNINRVKADIYLPKTYTGISADDILITVDGSSTSVKEFGGTVNLQGGNKITITYDKGLHSKQGITLSVRFPNDYFEFDHDRQAKLLGHHKKGLLDGLSGFLGKIAETFGFFALFIIAIYAKYMNFKKGFSKKIDTKSGALKGKFADKFPVIVQYGPPQGLNSAEVGLLLHREAKAKDMLSLIYKRATEGLINLDVKKTEGSIFSSSKDVIIITKNKDIPGDLPSYEQDFFRSLVRSEKNKIDQSTNLYSKLTLSSLERYGKSKGRLSGNKNARKLLLSLGLVLFFLFSYMLGDSYPGFVAFLFFAIMIGSFFLGGSSKLKETEEGAKLISHILGYREFLAACDENKLRLFLMQDPLYFDKILPYAVAFGLETELIKKIAPIMQELGVKSSWYNGDIHSMYMMDSIMSSVATHSVPASYSSSGGFSGGSSFGGGFSFGGGGGGGGGRSW